MAGILSVAFSDGDVLYASSVILTLCVLIQRSVAIPMEVVYISSGLAGFSPENPLASTLFQRVPLKFQHHLGNLGYITYSVCLLLGIRFRARDVRFSIPYTNCRPGEIIDACRPVRGYRSKSAWREFEFSRKSSDKISLLFDWRTRGISYLEAKFEKHWNEDRYQDGSFLIKQTKSRFSYLMVARWIYSFVAVYPRAYYSPPLLSSYSFTSGLLPSW